MVGAGFASALYGKFEKVELDPASIDPASFKTIDTRRRMFPREEATAEWSPRDIDGHARFPGPLPAWDDDPVDPAGPRSSSGISATSKECAMATRSVGESAAKRSTKSTALPESMVSGKASAAKAAVGDQPVFAYIAGLPQPQRGIAERIDQLAAASLPGLQRLLRHRRWLVLQLRRVRRPRQADVRQRQHAGPGTAGDAAGDGQVDARDRARFAA
jgi:hypothetical protein